MTQELIQDTSQFQAVADYLKRQRVCRLFLVCGKSIELLPIYKFFSSLPEKLNIKIEQFTEFSPNPKYDAVVDGVAAFRKFGGDIIVAVGGGSAMDVAKCIKLYSNMDAQKNYLQQEIVPNNIPFLAIPTTAGTGSEATQFAVIYFKGNKQSVSHPSCIPSAVLLCPSLLQTLPVYQKKVTMMDALCHSIEASWSVNSTPESLSYSLQAIKMILQGMDYYLDGEDMAAASILHAANLAGKAINITQTTAAHAMSYKLTSLYGLPHGHSVALCLASLWRYMLDHVENCVDPRGIDYVQRSFQIIAQAMGCGNPEQAVQLFIKILKRLELGPPNHWALNDIELLAQSVNPVRLKNNPIALTHTAFTALYTEILNGI